MDCEIQATKFKFLNQFSINNLNWSKIKGDRDREIERNGTKKLGKNGYWK